MSEELLLKNVATAVKAWRQTKKHRTALLPEEIASDIRELAKYHKKGHIAEILKMSGSTINRVLRANTKPSHFPKAPPQNKTNNPSRKIYSLKERQAVCEEWKRSGMKANEFSKAKKISKSALYQWSRGCRQPLDKKQDWFEVKAARAPATSFKNTVLIDFSLPNQAIARIEIPKTEAVSFLKEFYHAIAIVR